MKAGFGTACFLSFALMIHSDAQAQPPGANYDEAKVPKYTLPDPLVTAEGKKVTSAPMWREVRRPEILKLFQTEVYGRTPSTPKDMFFKDMFFEAIAKEALGHTVMRKQVTIHLDRRKDGPKLHLLIYLPVRAKAPVPVFLGLNFNGNHAVHTDPGITLSTAWMRDDAESAYVNHRATEKSRGSEASRWAVEKIVARGYALATMYYGDIDPDYDDGFQNGVHPLFYKDGQAKPAADEWGSIGAWAWGLSRALDYLETDRDIDAKHVAVMGHSRLGKTALWAAAQDERFALVISNNSGCGGAALSMRAFGETVERINKSFPHWFCGNFQKYNGQEDKLPVDQHMLIALIAPRPVYVASAQEDLWADPRGEYLSLHHAEPVYRLLGTNALGGAEMPALNKPVHHTLGYHIRTGKHDVTEYDWQQYLDFADKHFGRNAR
jgi:hypothetical protein